MQGDPSTIQSVDRALRLLWELDNPRGVTVTTLARKLGLLPTTAGRLLATLERHRLVERDPRTREYRLGLGILELNARLQARLDLRSRLEPVAYQLAEAVRENVGVVRLDGDSMLQVLDVDGAADQALIVRFPEGDRGYDLHATAAGKVLLAYLPESTREQRLSRLSFTRNTATTITDPRAFRAHLELVREQGYALCLEENLEFIRGMAAPVRDHQGIVVATVNIHGPSMRFTDERMATLLPQLLAAAEEASARLGCHGVGTNGDGANRQHSLTS